MYRLVILEPRSSFSSERGDIGDLFVHSDTLSAALICTLSKLRIVSNEIDKIAENPPFRVSSFLPIIRENNKNLRLFYPIIPCRFKPIQRIEGAQDTAMDRKQEKRIQYGDREFLEFYFRGGKTQDEPLVIMKYEDKFVLKSLFQSQEGRTLAQANQRTGVGVDRLTGGPLEDILFDICDITVTSSSLLLGVVLYCEDHFLSVIRRAFDVLGLSGIGSNRSTGHGQFQVKAVERYNPPEMGSGYHLLLSLYHPSIGEFKTGFMNNSLYRLEKRGGYITSKHVTPLRRPPVTMITEGSLIKGRKPDGEIIRVLDTNLSLGLSHPVYRDGRAISIEVELSREVIRGHSSL